MSELEEVNLTVLNINSDIYGQVGELFMDQVVLKTNGEVIIINFMDELLWRSDEDERTFCEDSGTYEPIEDYVRKRFMKLLEKIKVLTNIKLL